MRVWVLVAGVLPVLFMPVCAFAQANANAVAEAVDAFGYTTGDESVGIYDESSVRGFDLEAAGNYRFNGTYFVKSSGTSSFFIESTTVRIGYNTLRSAFPGPSRVVDFRLRDPAADEPTLLTVGLNEYEQPYLDLLLKGRRSDGRASGALGLGLVFDRNDKQGGDGRSWRSPSGRASRLCISRQKAQPLIWDARNRTRYSKAASRPRAAFSTSNIAFMPDGEALR